MTVKELIELNLRIGDIDITVRDKNGIRLRGYHIGANSGIEPVSHPYTHEDDVYKKVNINAFDDDKDYFDVLINRIPKPLLELEVHAWTSSNAYRKGKGITGELERIDIEVWNGAPVRIKDETIKSGKQLEGQLDLKFI